MNFWLVLIYVYIQNAVTHTNNVVKNLVRIDWQPPKYYMGTAIFRWDLRIFIWDNNYIGFVNHDVVTCKYRTTFVQDVSTFWVKTESISVTFVMPDGSTHDPMTMKAANNVWILLK